MKSAFAFDSTDDEERSCQSIWSSLVRLVFKVFRRVWVLASQDLTTNGKKISFSFKSIDDSEKNLLMDFLGEDWDKNFR